MAQNSALFPLAAITSTSPAFSTASSSSFCMAASSLSLSSFSFWYSSSSHGRLTVDDGALVAIMPPTTLDFLLNGLPTALDDDEPSPTTLSTPSIGCARYR